MQIVIREEEFRMSFWSLRRGGEGGGGGGPVSAGVAQGFPLPCRTPGSTGRPHGAGGALRGGAARLG